MKGLPNCLSNCESRMSANNTHLPYAGNIVDYIATNIHVAFAVVPLMDLGKQGTTLVSFFGDVCQPKVSPFPF